MQIWEVNGIDDLEGTCFAQCSTKEKAEKQCKFLKKTVLKICLRLNKVI